MKMRNLFVGIAIACFMLVPISSQAADWAPKGAIKLQIGFGAGGSTDMLGRMVTAQIEKTTGWNVVAENKPGGGGVAMFSSLKNQKPDGLTLGLCVQIPIQMQLAKRGDTIPFTFDSFEYIATITKGENALVAKPDAPFNNFQELLAYAKKEKGITVAYDADPQKMILGAVSNQTGTKFRYVTHKSGAEQIQSILGGHVSFGCLAGAHIKYVESGDLKMIAVLNKGRHSYSPETKTLMESGFNFYFEPYYYVAAPKGLPADVKKALVKAFADAISSSEVKKVLANTLKAEPYNLGPDGTYKMLTQGLIDIKSLIKASE